MYSELDPRKFARFEKRASVKLSKTNPYPFLVRTTLKKDEGFCQQKRLLLIKRKTSFVFNHLSCYGTVRTCTNFGVQQKQKNQPLSQKRNYPLIRVKKNPRTVPYCICEERYQ